MSHVVSGELGGLSARERLVRYRAFERAALLRAGETKFQELRHSYLELAQGWATLAEQLERVVAED